MRGKRGVTPDKSVWARIAQQNKLFHMVMGPDSHLTSERNKRRIFRALFEKERPWIRET